MYFPDGNGVVVVHPDGRREAVDFDHGQDPDRVWPEAVAATSDGSLYVYTGVQIFRLYQDGTAVAVAGGGPSEAIAEDGDLAITLATVGRPVVRGNDVYFNVGEHVHRLEADGTVSAGIDIDTGGSGYAVDNSGNVYVTDRETSKVYRVAPDGEKTTTAGNGKLIDFEHAGDEPNLPTKETAVGLPDSVAVADDGTVYIADGGDIRRVDPDGTINTILANTRADSLALDRHGNLYFGEPLHAQIKVIVRPAELDFSDPFPWTWVKVVGAVLLLGSATALIAHRRKSSPTAPRSRLAREFRR